MGRIKNSRRRAWLGIAGFTALLLALWLPWAIPLYLIWGEGGTVSWLSLGVLYLLFMALLRLWGIYRHGQVQPWAFYGLVWRQITLRELGLGWGCGLGLIALLYGIQWGCGWIVFRGLPANFGSIFFEGLLTGLAVGFAEELLFRGWLQRELELAYGSGQAVVFQALIFAGLHFIRPLDVILTTSPQFIGLVLLGCSLGWAKQAWGGRLGVGMGLHGGLVGSYFWVNIGQLWQVKPAIPSWLTGVGGNPLAGLVGVGLLLLVSLVLRTRAVTSP